MPASEISLLSPCATTGYTAPLRRRKSPGNSERSSHNPAATAAAHVTETKANCSQVRHAAAMTRRERHDLRNFKADSAGDHRSDRGLS